MEKCSKDCITMSSFGQPKFMSKLQNHQNFDLKKGSALKQITKLKCSQTIFLAITYGRPVNKSKVLDKLLILWKSNT